MLKDYAGIGAAEAERVRQHATKLHVVATLAHDRYVLKGGIKRFDIGALANETAVHHQDGIDRLLRACRSQRMSGKRFCCGYRGALSAEHFANGLDLLAIADRSR